jgi:NAD(P)H dehydrogenase (quinone)
MRILVTGATGQLGNAVIQILLTKISANQISVITRKEEKRAELESDGFRAFLGNYDDVNAIEKAMEGVDTVLLISSGDAGDRMQEHKNVVDAAQKKGVKNIAYTSRSLRDRHTLVNKLMLDHFETEDYIKLSGLNYIFFRNVLYMDALPLFLGGKMALERGIFQPAGAGKVAFALRREMGEAMANVLLNEGFVNQVYHFTGEKAYSFDDIAATLTELSSKKVTYTDVDSSFFEKMMQQRNVPQPMIKKMVDFVTDIKQNQEKDVYDDLKTKLGRPPTNLLDGLKILFDFQ